MVVLWLLLIRTCSHQPAPGTEVPAVYSSSARSFGLQCPHIIELRCLHSIYERGAEGSVAGAPPTRSPKWGWRDDYSRWSLSKRSTARISQPNIYWN